MKARVKDTGQILEVMTVKLENGFYYSINRLEIEPNPTPDHWQDVRERAAIAAMKGLLAHNGGVYTESFITKEAIIHADALVVKLKGE